MTEKLYCAIMLFGKEILRMEVLLMAIDPIAVAIKSIIKEKGLLQKTVAKKAGFTELQFSDMMNDRKIIKSCDLYPISTALGVSIQDIYDIGNRIRQ